MLKLLFDHGDHERLLAQICFAVEIRIAIFAVTFTFTPDVAELSEVIFRKAQKAVQHFYCSYVDFFANKCSVGLHD